MSKSKIILINGACWIGKSTIAKLVHQAIEFSFLREKDEQRRKFSHYKDTPSHYKRSRELTLQLSEYMIKFCIDQGIDLIREGLVQDKTIIKKLETITKIHWGDFYHIYLNASKDIREKRLFSRGIDGSLTHDKAKCFYRTLSQIHKELDSMIEIDTSTLGPQEVCDKIVNIIAH